ncbi:hypothetical protein EDC48_10230 [Gibbsiella quercinecans]|nr:hypothetical protein EDC48_10230 [Gibbsiella quercinecans]
MKRNRINVLTVVNSVSNITTETIDGKPHIVVRGITPVVDDIVMCTRQQKLKRRLTRLREIRCRSVTPKDRRFLSPMAASLLKLPVKTLRQCSHMPKKIPPLS